MIKIYQYCISGYSYGCCKFYPSCSNYALLAIKQCGVLKGGWLIAKRILKCQPFQRGGYDPLPDN